MVESARSQHHYYRFVCANFVQTGYSVLVLNARFTHPHPKRPMRLGPSTKGPMTAAAHLDTPMSTMTAFLE